MRNMCLVLLMVSFVFASTTVELVITEAQLQEAFEESVIDPNVDSVGADILMDKVVLSATRTRPLTGIVDEASMDIYLDVVDGHLSVTIENAQWNGLAIGDARVAVWNDRIQRGIQLITGDTHGLLKNVTVGSNQIVMTWEQ